jgi:hypothetical protein
LTRAAILRAGNCHDCFDDGADLALGATAGYGANDDDDRCGGGDVAIEASDGVSDAAVIATDDVTQVLGVKPRRQFGRAHEVAELHRQLAPLCVSSVEML